MAVRDAQHLFTIEEYALMAQAGIFAEDDRVELIEGAVIEMSPIGRLHAACVDRLNALLNRYLGAAVIVRVQSPIRLSAYSEPQPDIALLRPRADFYAAAHPGPDDVHLVVEVADASLQYDRGVKLALYAQAEIREVWLVDLAGDVIEMYSQPSNGAYSVSTQARRGQTVALEALPGLHVAVAAILG